MESRTLVSSIRRHFPELRVNKYRRVTSGWESIVLEANGKYIFRFPKLPKGWSRLRNEIIFLKWLAPNLAAAVPNYEFVWWGNRKHPQKLAGYKKIQGIPCTGEVFRSEWTTRLGKDLGRFLTELHSLRVPPAISELVPRYTKKSWIEDQQLEYRRIQKVTYPLLDAGTRKRADEFWTRFLAHLSHTSFKLTLIHADLFGGNVIADPSTGKLNGAIDWGWTVVGDPALDFRGVFRLSRELGDTALANYDLEKNDLRERAIPYSTAHTFGEVAYGVWIGERGPISAGLEGIKELLV